jgi:predicted DsbA family dithiol-disulfide isomerase
MDITAMEAAMASPELLQRLSGDREQAARLQLRSAPVWFVDGYRFVGQQSERTLRRAWELAIADRQGG